MGYDYTRVIARQQIADLLQDYLPIQLDAGSSQTVLIDADKLVDRDNKYSGIVGVVTAAANPLNVGARFKVLASSQTNHALQIDHALPAAPSAGDKVDLFNLFGRGYAIETYDRIIANSVDVVFPSYMLLETADILAYDASTKAIGTLPENWYYVYKVEIRRTDSVDRYDIPERWWDTEPATHELLIRGNEAAWQSDGQNLRVYGCTKPPVPATDTDVINVPKNWLHYKCAAALAMGNRTDRALAGMATQWANMATSLEPATDIWNLPTLKILRWAS